MMRRVLLLMTLAAGPLSAQLPARLGADAKASIERVVDSARARGLPTEVIIDKAREGVLKGADDLRIVAAVQSLARELGDARVLLGPSSSTALLTATASALHARIPAAELRHIIRAQDGRAYDEGRVSSALVVLVDVVAKRVPIPAATFAMAQLMERGTPEQQIQGLRAEVEQDIAGGMSPETSMRARASARLRLLDVDGQRGALIPLRSPPLPDSPV